MLNLDYTGKILGMQEVEIKNVRENENYIEIAIELPRKNCICPSCGKKTSRIHDYRQQKVKELPAFGKNVLLLHRKRRYVCSCGKRFAEPNPFLSKYQRMTRRVIIGILDRLRDCGSYTSAAREFHISTSTVIRFFKNIQYSKPVKLPEVIGIDEFKGNSGGEKFHRILTDLEDMKVLDTNGFTEGCNNKIKVLKRNAYGLKNFKRFRNRILFMFSHQSRARA